MSVWVTTAATETVSMCGHADDKFDTWVGAHHCPAMPRRVWFGPVIAGRIDGTPFAHYGECGWTVAIAGLFVAWAGWR